MALMTFLWTNEENHLENQQDHIDRAGGPRVPMSVE